MKRPQKFEKSPARFDILSELLSKLQNKREILKTFWPSHNVLTLSNIFGYASVELKFRSYIHCMNRKENLN